MQADVLQELETSSNALSIWLIEDDFSLDRVIDALSVARERPANIDYVLFDVSFLEENGFVFVENLGDTPDNVANLYHRDLVNLSTNNLISLANFIAALEIKRIKEKVVAERLRSYIQLEGIDRMKVDPIMLNKLGVPVPPNLSHDE